MNQWSTFWIAISSIILMAKGPDFTNCCCFGCWVDLLQRPDFDAGCNLIVITNTFKGDSPFNCYSCVRILLAIPKCYCCCSWACVCLAGCDSVCENGVICFTVVDSELMLTMPFCQHQKIASSATHCQNLICLFCGRQMLFGSCCTGCYLGANPWCQKYQYS